MEPWICENCSEELWDSDLASKVDYANPLEPRKVSICPYCSSDKVVYNDNYDPTPVHQHEVTEGTSERERWDTMIRNLP